MAAKGRKESRSGGKMTVEEAGRRGGQVVKQKYGPEFYSEIGQKGGEAVKEKYGSEFYSEIGQKGGEARKEELARWITGYLAALGVPRREDEIEFHGHPLPIWAGPEPVHAWGGRVLLVGDAAGLVNPLFGDGISYACRSGALAGQAMAEAFPDVDGDVQHGHETAPDRSFVNLIYA